MKNLILFLSITIASGLLITNVYNSMIDARSWGSNIPTSIETTRAYFKEVNPGNFYRVFSPINQILGLLVVILFWKTFPSVRLYLGVAFIMYLMADAITFKYFYPRNEIMFKTTSLADVEILKTAWQQWSNMNWVRSLILLIGIAFSWLSLHKIYIGNTVS